MPKRDPSTFPETTAERRRRLREQHAFAQDVSGTPEQPGASSQPETPGGSAKATRRTRGAGETVVRATFWLTEADREVLEELRLRVRVPGTPGVPDKSAVIRHALRSLAREHGVG